MSENKMATKVDLQEFYNRIYPYLGGSAQAGFTPVGTVISVMSNHAPANYLVCDGTVYNIADYPELANHFLNEFGSKNYFGGDGTTSFAVPDLRGEFLRGTGTNGHAEQGSGAAVGVHQDGTNHVKFNAHSDGNINFNNVSYVNSLLTSNNEDSSVGTNSANHKWNASGSSGNLSYSDTPYYTSRPTNTSVLFCIATKNIYLNPSLDYSTDEKVVGTWIDGKPLYQRTVIMEPKVANTWVGYDLGSTCIVRGITAIQDTNAREAAPSTDFSTSKSVRVVGKLGSTEGRLGMIATEAWYFGKYYVTAIYTKTTD